MGIFSSAVIHALRLVLDKLNIEGMEFSSVLIVYGAGSFLSFRHYLISNLGLNSMTKVMVRV
jgi:hypothetical protein